MTWCSPWWEERNADLARALAELRADCPPLWLPQLQECGVCFHDLDIDLGVAPVHDCAYRCARTEQSAAYHLDRAGWDGGRVIEWGGGAGALSHVLRERDRRREHTIIDTPTMLGVVRQTGAAGTLLVESTPKALDRMNRRPVELFVGTFSVSECSTECHDYLFGVDWFGASTVLLALEPGKTLFPDAPSLHARCLEAGFVEEASPFPGAVYLKLSR